MDVGKVASLYIHGSERAIAGNEMYMTAELKRPYDVEILRRSYLRFVKENAPIASKLVEDGADFAWRRLGPDELATLLRREDVELRGTQPLSAIQDHYFPTNERLPFRIVRVAGGDANRKLVFCVNHAFANGRGLLSWVAKFFEAYALECGQKVPTAAQAPVRAPGWLSGLLAAAVGFFWTVVYLVGFLRSAGKQAATETVDLARLGVPPLCRAGFVVRTYHFSREQTSALLASCRELGLTMGQRLGAAMAQAFLDEQPERRRVCLSMPVDLRGELPHLPPRALGNYTGTLVVQLFRGHDLAAQMRSASRWFARRVPYFMTRLVGLAAPRKLFDRFAERARLENPARAPFENFTFALSNLGRLEDPVLSHFVERMSGHTRTQTLFAATVTHNGQLAVEVSFPRDLFPSDQVVPVLDRVFGGLRAGEPVRHPEQVTARLPAEASSHREGALPEVGLA